MSRGVALLNDRVRQASRLELYGPGASQGHQVSSRHSTSQAVVHGAFRQTGRHQAARRGRLAASGRGGPDGVACTQRHGSAVIAHPAPGLVEALGQAGIFAYRDDPTAWIDALKSLGAPRPTSACGARLSKSWPGQVLAAAAACALMATRRATAPRRTVRPATAASAQAGLPASPAAGPDGSSTTWPARRAPRARYEGAVKLAKSQSRLQPGRKGPLRARPPQSNPPGGPTTPAPMSLPLLRYAGTPRPALSRCHKRTHRHDPARPRSCPCGGRHFRCEDGDHAHDERSLGSLHLYPAVQLLRQGRKLHGAGGVGLDRASHWSQGLGCEGALSFQPLPVQASCSGGKRWPLTSVLYSWCCPQWHS